MGFYTKKNEQTESAFISAYIDALYKRHYKDITVDYLCEKAGINRSTFYRHYDNLEELISQCETRILGDIKNVLSTFRIHDWRLTNEQADDVLVSSFAFTTVCYKYRHELVALLSDNSRPSFRNQFLAIHLESNRNIIETFDLNFGVYQRLIENAYAQIAVNEIYIWLKEDNMTPIEAARYYTEFAKIVSSIIKNIPVSQHDIIR